MTRHANIHWINNTIYAYAMSTTASAMIADTTRLTLSAASPQSEKGALILRALSGSRQNIRYPWFINRFTQKFEKWLGMKWNEFVKRARQVCIEQDGDVIRIVIWKRRLRPAGFEESGKPAIELINPTAEQLGQALEEAFDQCDD